MDGHREEIVRAKWDAASVSEATLLSVAQVYFEALHSDARVQASEARLQTATALLDQAKEFVTAGTASHLDELRARVAFENENRTLAELAAESDLARLRLLKLMGLNLDEHLSLTENISLKTLPMRPVEELVAQAMENRPDARALQAKSKAVGLDREKARVQRYPTIETAANYGRLGPSLTSNIPTYAVFARLNVPIFQGGRISRQMEIAETQARQTALELEDLKLQIQLDVRTALVRIDRSTSMYKAAHNASEAARASLELARLRFDAGISENLDLIRAQEELAQAEDREIRAALDLQLAQVSLAAATGSVMSVLD
jgi:outer membrane protein TolC